MNYFIGIIVVIILYYLINDTLKKSRNKAQLKKYCELYGDEFGTMVTNHKVGIGMTMDMVEDSWGKPGKVDGKVMKKDYLKSNFYYIKYNNKAGYKYRVTVINGYVTEIREY